MPVFNKPSSDRVQPISAGIVNAVFSYNSFFKDLFRSDSLLLDDVSIKITDTADASPIYKHSDLDEKEAGLASTATISIANRSWDITTSADKNFGTQIIQVRSPYVVIIAGELITLMLLAILILQNNSRKHAFELADLITKDLQQEKTRLLASKNVTTPYYRALATVCS